MAAGGSPYDSKSDGFRHDLLVHTLQQLNALRRILAHRVNGLNLGNDLDPLAGQGPGLLHVLRRPDEGEFHILQLVLVGEPDQLPVLFKRKGVMPGFSYL